MKFHVQLEKAEEGGYVVTCPALPGCVTQGETPEEAIANVREAIQGWLEVNDVITPIHPGAEVLEVAI